MAGHFTKQFFDIIDLLTQPCGTTISEICKRLGVQKRQAYRLTDMIQDKFKFGLIKDKDVIGGEVRYYLEEEQSKRLLDMKVADVNLSITEIIALNFLKGHARLYKETGIEKEIERAFAKLDAFAPKGFGKRLDKIKSIFLPAIKSAKEYKQKEAIIDSLTDAMLSQHTCKVEYYSFSSDTVKHFKIDPLHFFERDGGLYIFVRTTDYDDIRLLAVERIMSIGVTEEGFEEPADFDPENLLENAFGIVFDDPLKARIWFSADQARYVRERQWAKGQKITTKKDGSIVLTMETSGWWDVKKWVLSFGAEAEVLEPEEMRKEIKNEIKKAWGRYE